MLPYGNIFSLYGYDILQIATVLFKMESNNISSLSLDVNDKSIEDSISINLPINNIKLFESISYDPQIEKIS
jgi:hypothetical protein